MSKIKPEHFVRIWLEALENGNSISWIGNTLGVSDQTVHSLARTLRRKGVELPSIRRKFVEFTDVNQLNQLIRQQLGD